MLNIVRAVLKYFFSEANHQSDSDRIERYF